MVNPYTTFEDIKKFLPIYVTDKVLSEDMIFTEEDIQEFILDISAEMDERYLNAGYTVPLDLSSNERLRRRVSLTCKNGVGMLIVQAVVTDDDSDTLSIYETYKTQYYGDLSKIERMGFPDDIPRNEKKSIVSRRTTFSPPYDPIFTDQGVRIVNSNYRR